MQDIVSDDNTATIPGTGINRVDNVKTQNALNTDAIASQTAWNTNQAGRDVMTDVYLQCSYGNERPNLCLMTRSIFTAYNLSLQANERFVDIKTTANAGYPHLTFMVDMKVAWGDNILDGHFYMLNTDYIKFKVLKNKNFLMTDFLRQYNADVESALCTTGGQLCTGAPRYNGVYTGAAF